MPKYRPRIGQRSKKMEMANRGQQAVKREEFKNDMENYQALYLFVYIGVEKHQITRHFATHWSDSKLWLSREIVYYSLTFYNFDGWKDMKKLRRAIGSKTGVLFTNRPESEVIHWFQTSSTWWDYPQSGYQVDVDIILNPGPLTQFRPEIEPYLRYLGMRTALVKGTVMLQRDHVVCRAGNILSEKQVQLLELLGEKLSVYTLSLKGTWSKDGGYKKWAKRLNTWFGAQE